MVYENVFLKEESRVDHATDRPVHEVRLVKVKAAIWRNDTDARSSLTGVTFARIYKTDAGWDPARPSGVTNFRS